MNLTELALATHFRRALPAGLIAFGCFTDTIHAGVTNPDISAIGQVLSGYTDDADSPNSEQTTLQIGEAEIIFDAYLNPFLKGWFTVAGGEDGFALEEGYASLVKGLPWGLAMKAGKYRLGFGKLNPYHPHTYPFIDSPRSLQSLLFGEEGFNETGFQISALLPTAGNWASTLSGDIIEGKQFHEDEEGTRLGWLARWSNDILLGECTILQAGVSGASGTDNLVRETKSYLMGADVKAKFILSAFSQLTLQGEAVMKQSHSVDTVTGSFPSTERSGFYAYADYRYHTRWNGGILFEQWEPEDQLNGVDRAIKVFAGFSVLEESTLLRLGYERFLPEEFDAVNTVTLQLVFSMGPHKPHQF